MKFNFKFPRLRLSKKGYFKDKENNKRNDYLKALSRYVGYQDYSFRSFDPATLTKLYSDPQQGCSVVSTLIEKRARLAAEVMRYAKVRDVKTQKDVDNHPMIAVINNANDLEYTRDLLIKRISTEYDLYGESFVYKVVQGAAAFGKMRLYPMFSEKVEIRTGGLTNPIKGFEFGFKKGEIMKPQDVMWLRRYNPDADAGLHGLSPLVTAARLVELIEKGDNRVLNAFENGGVNNLLSPKQMDGMPVPKERVDEAEAALNDPANVGKSKMAHLPMDLLKLGDTPVNLGVLSTSEHAIKVLCFIYDYPFEMFLGTAKYSNQKEAKQLLYTQIGIPQAEMICQALTNSLGLNLEGKEFYIDIDSIDALREDVNVTMTAYVNAFASTNERRKLVGLDKLTGKEFDEPVIPLGVELGYTPPDSADLSDDL